MEIKLLERRMYDYLFRLLKWIFLDIVVAIIILKVQTFNIFLIFTLVFLCSVISTYDNLDRYRLLRRERKDLLAQ